MKSDHPSHQLAPEPIDNGRWHVVICSKTLGIVYAGRNELQAKSAAAPQCMAYVAANTLGDAHTLAAINAGKIREKNRRK